jgi:hypothetical protein
MRAFAAGVMTLALAALAAVELVRDGAEAHAASSAADATA